MICHVGPSAVKMYNSRGDVDNGEALYVDRLRLYGKSLYLPLNFAVNLKML